MQARFALLLPLLAWSCATAQTNNEIGLKPAPAGREQLQKEEQPDARRNQKVERIHLEDSGSVIDEVRFGGRTQSITVQPKANVPQYEIQPTDMARSRPGDHRDGMGSATGTRFWNLLRF
jgi:hypothetical protein